MRVNELFKFIQERHSIYSKKEAGMHRPWTRDRILQSYRFTNVYRELDTVTKWIADNWRTPHRHDKDLWFAMVVARLVNWPDSLEEIGYPVPWREEGWDFVKALEARKVAGEKVFTAAYMIHAGSSKFGSKANYLASQTLTPMWEKRRELRPRKGDTLESFYQRLHQCHDMGSFMAGQVVADIKYVKPLRSADDWHSWAISGPGSKKGLNLVYERDANESWTEGRWYNWLHALHKAIEPLIQKAGMLPLDAMNLQNCLCEYAKYKRGYSRSKYDGV